MTLFHVKGVPIRAHWTLLLVLPYLAIVFSAQFARVAAVAGISADELRLTPFIWGALLALALFVSVALHELAHTLVAIARGGRVRDITLMLLGGVSHFERIPERPATEALVAVVGPLVSLAIAGLLFVLLHAVGIHAADLHLGVFYLAYLNLVLGLFNLVPAFPMDGGRVLRAALATRLDRRRATDVAAIVGKVFAVGFAIVGVLDGSMLLVLIAVFVFFGAQAEAQGQRARAALSGLRVADLITHAPTVTLETRLDDVLPLMQRAGRLQAIAVDERGRVAGLVRAADVARVMPMDRAQLTVRALGPALQGVATVPSSASVADAVETAARHQADIVIVVDADAHTPLGLLALRDVADALRSDQQLRAPRRPRPV